MTFFDTESRVDERKRKKYDYQEIRPSRKHGFSKSAIVTKIFIGNEGMLLV